MTHRDNLTPFGVWLYDWWPRVERVSPHKGQGHWRLVIRRGWWRRIVLYEAVAQQHDDTAPMMPFLVCYWTIHIKVLGFRLLTWRRQTRLRKYKHRYPGLLAGTSLDVPGDWGYA